MAGFCNGMFGGGKGVRALIAATLIAAAGLPASVQAQDDMRPFADVSKGYEKVISTADGASFYHLWSKSKDGSLLAELPRGYEGQKHFISLTVASGEEYAGLQQGDMYVYWKRQDNRLLLMEPELGTRSTGDQESKSSVKRLFTDRVILDVPIIAMGPNNQPVIDMKELLAGRVTTFFGTGGYMSSGASGANPRLSSLKSAKAFPKNIEISYEMPTAGGRMKEFHYSISLMEQGGGYQPREADERVGYFTTVYRDLGKSTEKEKWVRYINRWDLQKRDAKLSLSPPKEPIVFYIEHTVPVRYRRWIRQALLDWNKAFAKVGILDAIEVYQQDEETGAHMEKDPEDVRYNFIRWLANDIGTAIGPSRVNPMTGQILDADIVLTDGWIRHFWTQFNEVMPELAMEGMGPETLAWLDKNPQWDPRIRLADPAKSVYLLAQRARRGVLAYGGHPIALFDPTLQKQDDPNMLGQSEYSGLANRLSQRNGLCLAASGKAFDVALMRMSMDMFTEEELAALDPARADEKDGEKKPKPDLLDGVPEWFIGPLMRDLAAHEVGHTLGLRHNFRASGLYTFDQINSDEVKGKKPFTASVMDYTAANMTVRDGKLAGDLTMIDVGAYDYWVIEYGYGTGDLKEVLKKNTQAELAYGTDEDVGNGDPLIRRYDFAKDPISYAKDQMEMARYHRGRLLDKFVKDGESWSKARRGYTMTLGMQTRGLSMMSSWVGGVHVSRAKKGDPDAPNPVTVVPAAQQREALKWCIENSFYDEAFGLTPALLEKMTVDRWLDGGGRENGEENAWPIHDRIAGIQSSVMTMLLNPTTARRVFDNEFRVPSDQDALTLPELIDTITAAVWSELDKKPDSSSSVRQPYISSLRRNLQREHLDRMIDLAMSGGGGEASKPVSNLAISKLRALNGRLTKLLGEKGDQQGNMDAYSFAHLSEAKIRIEKALDAQYIANGGGGFGSFMMFGRPTEQPKDEGRDSLLQRDRIHEASSTFEAPTPEQK
ncbi:MAG: zinc-dependent metalloprotease [Phycisphaerales bacterium]